MKNIVKVKVNVSVIVKVNVNVIVAVGPLIIFVHSNFFCIFAHYFMWTTIRIMANISLNDK